MKSAEASCNRRGFSLVELIIAALLGMVLIGGGVLPFVIRAAREARLQDQYQELSENRDLALRTIQEDVSAAALFGDEPGIKVDPNLLQKTAPAAIMGACFDSPRCDTGARPTGLSIIRYDDSSRAITLPTGEFNVTSNGPDYSIQFAEPRISGGLELRSGDWIVMESGRANYLERVSADMASVGSPRTLSFRSQSFTSEAVSSDEMSHFQETFANTPVRITKVIQVAYEISGGELFRMESASLGLFSGQVVYSADPASGRMIYPISAPVIHASQAQASGFRVRKLTDKVSDLQFAFFPCAAASDLGTYLTQLNQGALDFDAIFQTTAAVPVQCFSGDQGGIDFSRVKLVSTGVKMRAFEPGLSSRLQTGRLDPTIPYYHYAWVSRMGIDRMAGALEPPLVSGEPICPNASEFSCIVAEQMSSALQQKCGIHFPQDWERTCACERLAAGRLPPSGKTRDDDIALCCPPGKICTPECAGGIGSTCDLGGNEGLCCQYCTDSGRLPDMCRNCYDQNQKCEKCRTVEGIDPATNDSFFNSCCHLQPLYCRPDCPRICRDCPNAPDRCEYCRTGCDSALCCRGTMDQRCDPRRCCEACTECTDKSRLCAFQDPLLCPGACSDPECWALNPPDSDARVRMCRFCKANVPGFLNNPDNLKNCCNINDANYCGLVGKVGPADVVCEKPVHCQNMDENCEICDPSCYSSVDEIIARMCPACPSLFPDTWQFISIPQAGTRLGRLCAPLHSCERVLGNPLNDAEEWPSICDIETKDGAFSCLQKNAPGLDNGATFCELCDHCTNAPWRQEACCACPTPDHPACKNQRTGACYCRPECPIPPKRCECEATSDNVSNVCQENAASNPLFCGDAGACDKLKDKCFNYCGFNSVSSPAECRRCIAPDFVNCAIGWPEFVKHAPTQDSVVCHDWFCWEHYRPVAEAACCRFCQYLIDTKGQNAPFDDDCCVGCPDPSKWPNSCLDGICTVTPAKNHCQDLCAPYFSGWTKEQMCDCYWFAYWSNGTAPRTEAAALQACCEVGQSLTGSGFNLFASTEPICDRCPAQYGLQDKCHCFRLANDAQRQCDPICNTGSPIMQCGCGKNHFPPVTNEDDMFHNYVCENCCDFCGIPAPASARYLVQAWGCKANELSWAGAKCSCQVDIQGLGGVP